MPGLIESTIDKLLASYEKQPGKLLLCKICRTAITHQHAQTNMALKHQHRFTNPAGITYTIRCFAQAPGCTISGEPTSEDSWFAGYRWQIASCSECDKHLGWYFENNKQRQFFGLIHDLLLDAPE